jgi:putative membrane protein
MLSDAILAYLHFLSIFGVFATLSCEAALLRPAIIWHTGRWLYRVDIAYFVSAIAVVATGFSRAFFGLKGWAFYAHNPLFHAKIGVFVLIGLLSIKPTLLFIRWSRRFRRDEMYIVPDEERKTARRWVMVEVHLLMLVPLFAVLMARGFGH